MTSPARPRLRVWGIPFAPYSVDRTVAEIAELARLGRPSHVIAANTHYAMLSERDDGLRRINEAATFIVADGMPIVWASRLCDEPLPERVAGSDLIYLIAERAARDGHRIFLLGGGEGVADEAARRLSAAYPGLQVAGTACPPFREWTPDEEAALIAQVRASRADILITALTMPRGDLWLSRHRDELGASVLFNGGAASDFVAGRVRRAPRFVRQAGFEWAFRLGLEPRRLGLRYAQDAWFIARRIVGAVPGVGQRRQGSPRDVAPSPINPAG